MNNRSSFLYKSLCGVLSIGLFCANLSVVHAQSPEETTPTPIISIEQSVTETPAAQANPLTPTPQAQPKIAEAPLDAKTCLPGTGLMWTAGPANPKIAALAEAALSKKGIYADVSARAFGERDSCGTFEALSTDFSLTLKSGGTLKASDLLLLDKKAGFSDDVLTTLSPLGKPELGNVRITFGPGKTKSYANPQRSLDSIAQLPPANITGSSIAPKKVYLLVFNPTLGNGQDLITYMNWQPYAPLVQGIINTFQTTSGGRIQYSLAYTTIIRNEWPVKIDGFKYTEATYMAAYQNHILAHNPDEVSYSAIIDSPVYDICGKLNRGEIDELWMFGGPYFGFYESRLVGPNAYNYNGGPVSGIHSCNKLLPIMGLNYERMLTEAVHSFGHRTEASMTKVYGSWQENRTSHNWDRFGLVKAQSPNYSYSGCGSIHYPANGTQGYDYGNTSTVLSNCDDFKNYPNLANPLTVAQSVTCAKWGCNGLGYLQYWFSHLPTYEGCGTDAVSGDWWEYFADPNLALNPSETCPRPCPTITAWKGEYWTNKSLSGSAALCRDDADIDFDWGMGSPDVSISGDVFSARWTRTLNFDGGTYRFHIQHDDGARLYIDNVLKINFWATCCDWDVANVDLQPGSHTIRMEMFEDSGAAHARLWWEKTTAAQPDLVPAPLNGHDEPIVISTTPGTSTNDKLITGQLLYLDLGFSNTGAANITTNYYADFYIDEQRFIHYPFASLDTASVGGFMDWNETWITPGWHTAKLVLDPENAVAEENESNNIWVKQFYWNPLTRSFASVAAQDGWSLESAETSNMGSAINATSPVLMLGDNAVKRQYRSVLSFNTGSLPDTAIITGLILKVKKQVVVGEGDPLSIFQGFMMDIKKGFFGNTPTLELVDFQAAASKTLGPGSPVLANGVYNINLINGKDTINKLSTSSGLTQIRLRFKLDDNNNTTINYLGLYSGNAANAEDRPQLVVTYYVP